MGGALTNGPKHRSFLSIHIKSRIMSCLEPVHTKRALVMSERKRNMRLHGLGFDIDCLTWRENKDEL